MGQGSDMVIPIRWITLKLKDTAKVSTALRLGVTALFSLGESERFGLRPRWTPWLKTVDSARDVLGLEVRLAENMGLNERETVWVTWNMPDLENVGAKESKGAQGLGETF